MMRSKLNFMERDIMSANCIAWGKQALAAGQYKNAEDWYNQAMYLKRNTKDVPEIHYAMMYISALQRNFKEAIEHANEAMKGEQGMAAKYIRALLYLSINDYIKGFDDLECRWGPEILQEYFGNTRLWSGQKCDNLLIYAEQGYGDIFQFSRFLPLIKDKFQVGKIYFNVPVPCSELFKYNFRNSPEIEVISYYKDKEFDYVCQAISLAHLFNVTYDTVPPIHIEAPPESIEKFKSYKQDGKLLVGLCPEGRPSDGTWNTREWNKRRNIPKEELFEALKGAREDEFVISFITAELNPDLKTWSDTAGVIANCDFVITVDSGPAHLSAAMGKETWMLQHKQKCWRYNLLEPNKCAWYGDNLTQIEQAKEGDWSDVFKEMKEKLKNYKFTNETDQPLLQSEVG